jgi:tetratricopeptide (TPR) repeat protein
LIHSRFSLYFKSRGNVKLSFVYATYPKCGIWVTVAAYSRCLDLEPAQFAIFVARAQSLETLGKLDLALADYQTALEIDPNQPLVLANRAILFYELGNFLAAIQDLDRAIMLDPNNLDLHENRAIASTALESVE